MNTSVSATTGDAPASTAPSAVIYDGTCRFCVAGARRLQAMARPDSIELVSSADPEQLRRFPQIDPGTRERAVLFVGADGVVSAGALAIARVLSTRPVWRLVTWVYFVPGLRQIFDGAYRLVAANRHRIMGRTTAGGEVCENGTCQPPN